MARVKRGIRSVVDKGGRVDRQRGVFNGSNVTKIGGNKLVEKWKGGDGGLPFAKRYQEVSPEQVEVMMEALIGFGFVLIILILMIAIYLGMKELLELDRGNPQVKGEKEGNELASGTHPIEPQNSKSSLNIFLDHIFSPIDVITEFTDEIVDENLEDDRESSYFDDLNKTRIYNYENQFHLSTFKDGLEHFEEDQQSQDHKRATDKIIYSIDELLTYADSHQHEYLTTCQARFRAHWTAEKSIEEVFDIVTQKPSLFVRIDDLTTKRIALIRFLAIGSNSLDYTNPNIFLNAFNNAIKDLIDTGAILNIFKLDQTGSFLVPVILDYIFCHWHFTPLRAPKIVEVFEKWQTPICVEKRFYLFKYLISLKIAGISDNRLEDFLLQVQLDDSFKRLIDEAIKITRDPALLEFFHNLKRTNGSAELHTGSTIQRDTKIPGAFNGL